MDKAKKNNGQSFIYGATIMVVSTAIVKVLGMLFRIPLSNLIGESGMGYYSTAYDVYLPIYALAMAGLPVAVSRITAEYVQKGRYQDVRKTLKVAQKAFLVTGLTGFLLMLAIAYPFIVLTGNSGALKGMLTIAPSVLFCCIMSSYRGYYEGLRNMYPTAISTIIEAAGKLILGYGMAFFVIKYYGKLTPKSASLAAAAALLGITLGTVLSAVYLIVRHKKPGDGISSQMLIDSKQADSSKTILKSLIAISVPVVLGSLVTNIASLIDVTMVQRQLSVAVKEAPEYFRATYGEYIEDIKNSEIPNYLYGVYKGYAFTLYNLVPTITSVIGVSALPVLAMAWTKKDSTEVKKNVESMVKITGLVAIPCGIGLMALPYPILNLLFNTKSIDISANLLFVLGATAVFAGIMSPINNMLQAIGKQWVPVRNILVGAIIKIVVNFILVGIPQINIMGAPVGTLCCYVYIALSNMICIAKYSKAKPRVFAVLLKPLIAGVVTGFAAYFSNMLFVLKLPERLSVILAIMVAVLVYVIMLIALKAITEEDLSNFPKGDKLVKLSNKIKEKYSNLLKKAKK